jgi:hypothetical protein
LSFIMLYFKFIFGYVIPAFLALCIMIFTNSLYRVCIGFAYHFPEKDRFIRSSIQ